MRVLLLYPPPWKVVDPGQPQDVLDGPPEGYVEGDLDGDFFQTPHGLFTLGAQAIRAGHQVKVLNLSAYSWWKVEEVLATLDAEVVGMSCWTANRRGVALVAQLVKRLRPSTHVVVGGPHATPLAKEMLEHHAAIDTVCVGESEESLLELLERLERGEPTAGLAGTWGRLDGKIVEGPERRALEDLDVLEPAHRHFTSHILMTSRGCPWQCTFCGAETTWGRGFRGQSTDYVLDELELMLARLPVKLVQVKDDTFTANRKRAMELSRRIRERKLNFLWSCDTRVDVLTEELLREMRLAGCERLSLGVESGSVEILKAINKKITVEQILLSTELAKRVGIKVRFYMMLGNRGETAATFQETLRFLERARPHQYLFSCLSVYPGTTDFHDAEAAGWLDRNVYFREQFQELKVPFDASEEDTALMARWFSANKGLRVGHVETVEECETVLANLGAHHAAVLDYAAALFRADRLVEAEVQARRALELSHPCPGVVHNLLGCIAWANGDVERMKEEFTAGFQRDPQHASLLRNVQAVRQWLGQAGPARGLPLALDPSHEFALLESPAQPALPGPLPVDFATWAPPLPRPERRAPLRKLTVV